MKMKNKKKNIFTLTFISLLWIYTSILDKDTLAYQTNYISQEILFSLGSTQYSTDKNNAGKRILYENIFPDWPERIAYQKEKEKYYKSAIGKLQALKKLSIPDKYLSKILTIPEKDTLDYFSGTGFYKIYQNSETLPNIFDSRTSFLLKVRNREVRETFLKSYNDRLEKDN